MDDAARLERACYEIAMKYAERESIKLFGPSSVYHNLSWDERMLAFFELSYQNLKVRVADGTFVPQKEGEE